jgi:hypothetical protein
MRFSRTRFFDRRKIPSLVPPARQITGKAVRTRRNRRRRAEVARGCVLYRGPSPWAPEGLAEEDNRIVIIMTFGSVNDKTGDVAQIWLFADKLKPTAAKAAGLHRLVCGNCALTELCYVKLHQAPRMVWTTYKAGRYPDYDPAQHDRVVQEKGVRFGAYGDPVLIPIELVQHFAQISNRNYTGFTEQWARPEFQVYRPYYMASIHREEDVALADSLGWRHYRVGTNGPQAGEVLCPHQNSALSRVVRCNECNACNGAERAVGADQRRNIFAYPTGRNYMNTRWDKHLQITR